MSWENSFNDYNNQAASTDAPQQIQYPNEPQIPYQPMIASTQIQRGYEKQFVDMQAKRGNSGGPVIDRETGLVVGILCGSQTEGDSRLVEEINYIRPIKYIWETFVEEIK